MFSKDQTNGRVVCLADYERVKKGAIVPVANELYADVEQWVSEGNTLAEFDGYPELPMTEEQLKDWRNTASVSRRQAKQALLLSGLLSQVQPTIDAITDDTERAMVQIYWDDSQEFERMNAQLIGLGYGLGLTDEQIDQLFIDAEKR